MDLLDLEEAAGISADEAAAVCGVSRRTYVRRYRRSGPPPAVRRLLEILAGELPWKEFRGFRYERGQIIAPGGAQGATAEDLAALPLLRQEIIILRAERECPRQYILL